MEQLLNEFKVALELYKHTSYKTTNSVDDNLLLKEFQDFITTIMNLELHKKDVNLNLAAKAALRNYTKIETEVKKGVKLTSIHKELISSSVFSMLEDFALAIYEKYFDTEFDYNESMKETLVSLISLVKRGRI